MSPARLAHFRSNPLPSAAAPISGGRFIMTKPAHSRCSTSLLATISAMISSALWTRLRPWKRSAKASAAARSRGSAGAQRSARLGYSRVEAVAFAGASSGSLLSGGRPRFARSASRLLDVYARKWGTPP